MRLDRRPNSGWTILKQINAGPKQFKWSGPNHEPNCFYVRLDSAVKTMIYVNQNQWWIDAIMVHKGKHGIYHTLYFFPQRPNLQEALMNLKNNKGVVKPKTKQKQTRILLEWLKILNQQQGDLKPNMSSQNKAPSLDLIKRALFRSAHYILVHNLVIHLICTKAQKSSKIWI